MSGTKLISIGLIKSLHELYESHHTSTDKLPEGCDILTQTDEQKTE